MDDYLGGVDTEEGIRLVNEVIMISQKGGFELCGWASIKWDTNKDELYFALNFNEMIKEFCPKKRYLLSEKC